MLCFVLFCFLNLLLFQHLTLILLFFIASVHCYIVQALTSEIVSKELNDLILWLLIKDPKKRPNTKDIMNEVRPVFLLWNESFSHEFLVAVYFFYLHSRLCLSK